jgi:hypothetical protein
MLTPAARSYGPWLFSEDVIMARETGLHTHTQLLLEKGKQIVRVGVADAEYLLTATARAVRLHFTIRRNEIAKHRLLHELGKELWQSLPSESSTRDLRITESMREKARRIDELEEERRLAEAEAEVISVVREGKDASPRNSRGAPPSGL